MIGKIQKYVVLVGILCTVPATSHAFHIDYLDHGRIEAYRRHYRSQLKTDSYAKVGLFFATVILGGLIAGDLFYFDKDGGGEKKWKEMISIKNGCLSIVWIAIVLDLLHHSRGVSNQGVCSSVLSSIRSLWKKNSTHYLTLWAEQLYEDSEKIFNFYGSLAAYAEQQKLDDQEKYSLFWFRNHILNYHRLFIGNLERIVALLSIDGKVFHIDLQDLQRKVAVYTNKIEYLLNEPITKNVIFSVIHHFQEIYDQVLRSVRNECMRRMQKK